MEDTADTAAVSTPPGQSSGTLVLQSLEVRPALQANTAHTVAIPYQATGDLRMLQACLQWSPDGPYCFSFRDIPGQSRIETQVRIDEPGTYNLEAFVKYSSGGQFLDSNKVVAAVTVR
jgi:hypothetical protein